MSRNTRNSTSSAGSKSDDNSVTVTAGTEDSVICNVLDQKGLDSLIKALTPAITATIEKCLESKLVQVLADMNKLKQDYSSAQKRISDLETEVVSLKTELKSATDSIEDINNYTRRDNLVIHGLSIGSYAEAASQNTQPSSSSLGVQSVNSDTVARSVVEFCRNQLHVNIAMSDISTAHRLRQSTSASAADSQRSMPSVIIVRFVSRRVRDEVYSARKSLKGNPSTSRIFINEHLSNETSALFRQARQSVKNKTIHSAWTFNGQVFIKRDNLPTTRPLRVRLVDNLM